VLATWLIALPIYALFPVAPPRLAGIGLVDTITTQTGIALDSKLTTSFYNPIAAVPSLHAGFAVAVSAALGAVARRRLTRVVAWLWAPTVCLAVVATGNHFVADIVAGVVVTVVGYGLGRAVARAASGDRTVVTPVPALATSG
jgi:short subunit fatty acids transporter